MRDCDRGLDNICTPRMFDRTTDELIGICRGILADGSINQAEVAFLQTWLSNHKPFANDYPFNVLMPQIASALEDGRLTSDEERDLLDMLVRFVGGEFVGDGGLSSLSTALPLDDPAPAIEWDGNGFLATGVFAFGPRKQVHHEIASRQGIVLTGPSKAMRYLVVGDVGSARWMHSSYGRKIERAIELRSTGHPVAIVSEAHWANAL